MSRNLIHDSKGAAAVELAITLPLLVGLLFGIFKFGMAMNYYIELTDAVRVGARNLSASRLTTTPYSSTVSTITGAVPNLAPAKIGITLNVNGTACTADSTCVTTINAAQSKPLVVTATYPCDISIPILNYTPNCQLSATTSEMVE